MAYTITVIICQLSLKSYVQFFLKARKKKTIHKNLYKKILMVKKHIKITCIVNNTSQVLFL